MNYDGWIEEGFDAARFGRLSVGYLVGTAILGGVVAWLALHATNPQEVSAEEAIEVSLADFPEEEEPEVEPEPEIVEPPPPPPPPAAAPPPPEEEMPYEPDPAPAAGEEAPDVPDEVPDEAPDQKDAKPDSGDDPFKKGFGHGGKPGGTGKGPGVGTGTAPAPPPPPPPKKPKARRSLETTAPAIRLSCPRPSPPPAVVGEGGVVMVKLKVDVSGAVVRVKAASGPAALRPFAEQAAMGCRFKPAKDKDTGQPVPFLMVLPFQFTSKT